MDDLSVPVTKVNGSPVLLEDLDKSFDSWVHTGRQIVITKCAPDSELATRKLRDPRVYPIRRHIRGRVLLISNTGYQALRLLKDLFEQLQYKISIHTEKTSQQVQAIIQSEASKDDNQYVDSFVIIIYGTPDGFQFGYIPELLNAENAPSLQGKPKLIYVIGSTDEKGTRWSLIRRRGNDTIVQQVPEIARVNQDPDYLLASTGFNGVMFYIYVLCLFVHELSAKDIWKLLMQFADRHRFTSTCHCTLTKEFYFFPGLTSSVMPETIQSMDPGDMDLYMKMLEHGKMRTYNVRLMFVGLYGAGKTSTARRIMGKTIDDVTSTDGIDVYIGKCKVDIRSGKWETLEDTSTNMPYKKLSSMLLTDEESASRVPDIKNLEYKPEENQGMETPVTSYNAADEYEVTTGGMARNSHRDDDDVSNIGRKRRRTDDVMMASPSSDEPMDFDLSIKSPSSVGTHSSTVSDFEMVDSSVCNNEYLRTAQLVIQESHKQPASRTKEATVSLWDFAGQFVYYATHQLFFSPRAVYLLVLNMAEDLDKTLSEDWYVDLQGREPIEAQGGVMFWLRSIFTYARGSQPGIPPIIIVGTHKDMLPGDEQQKREKAQEYFNKIRTIFQGTPLSHNLCKESFLLDNTNVDTEMEALQNKMLEIAKTMPFWGEQIPAKWVELEQALEDRRVEGKPFISMRELEEIDKTLAKPINDKEQLNLFLRAHHETGTLIYFDEAKHLRDIIVLDPQWIIHAFRYLISAQEFGQKYGPLEELWRKFIATGRLEMKLAVAIWQQDRIYQFYENHEKLLHFLEKLDIIARASIIKEDGQNTEQLPFYYVPCLLKSSPDRMLLEMPSQRYCVNTPVLCISFKDHFLPPAVFNRVVAICLGKWPLARQGKRNLIYCGCAIFEVSYGKGESKHRMTLFFKKSKIGVRITRYSSKGATIADPSICDRVRRVITSAVRKEFARFQAKSEGSDEPFVYLLQCKETVEKDFLDDGLHSLEDLVDAVDTDYFCEKHTDKLHPHALSAVDMLQEWFPEKVPPNFRLDSVSTVELWLTRLPDSIKNEKVSDRTLSKLSEALGDNWQSIVLELGVKQTAIDRVREGYHYSVLRQIYHALLEWRDMAVRREDNTATNITLLSAMREVKTATIDWEMIQNIVDGFQ